MAISNSFQPKPIQPQIQQQQMNQQPKTLENQAQNVLRQLQSNPAFLKTISEKFKAESKKEVSSSSSASVSTAQSSFTHAESSDGPQDLGLSGVKQQGKSEMASQMKRAKMGGLSAVEKLAPAIGGAAGSAEVSGEVGSAAGMKGARKGGGLLGAVLAKELSFGGKKEASEADKPKKTKSQPAIYFNQVHSPVVLSPKTGTKAPGKRAAPAAQTLESQGQKKLSDALQGATGKIAEFLKDSNVGKMLKSVDGLHEALATKANERLKSEMFFLNFA